MAARITSPKAWLARAGFNDATTSARFASSPELEGLAEPGGSLLLGVAQTADPDRALKSLVRFVEAAGRSPELDRLLGDESVQRSRLLEVLGQSAAMGEHLVRHPEHHRAITDAVPLSPHERTELMVAAVRPDQRGQYTGEDALRIEYRRQLVGIMALDVSAPDPQATMPETAAALADLAGAALEAALDVATEQHPEAAEQARLAVIAMGKCGGRELNYLSDVDVIFAAEPVGDTPEAEAMHAATQLAATLMKVCSSHTPEGSLWQVDPALRPEGKQGQLVRTVASHVRYYKRWAKTWEFQALLKARAVAGDPEVGAAYMDAIGPFVWEAAGRDNFVTDVQAMRARVLDHIPAGEVDRQLKLGPGGLRDVEFSVQLLQMVHGRTDESLRSRNTLEALAALAEGGYIGREDKVTLEAAYRFLRSVEHRVQFHKMKRTHLMPTKSEDLVRLGRGLRLDKPSGETLKEAWQGHRATVRQLHRMLFYRPLLSAVARLSPQEARLSPESAKQRLSALGFRDPTAALRNMEALTQGVSRTASIQRTLLPVMLAWFAEEVDPDAGLLAFRRISESLGRTPWYLRMLRDEGQAAKRLAKVLARSRFLVSLLEQAPESAQILSGDDDVLPRGKDEVLRTMRSALARQDDPEEAMTAARKVRRAELFRCALGDLIDSATTEQTMEGITALNEAALQAALDIAGRTYEAKHGSLPVDLALIGMGRLGGGECGFSSDADVVPVHAAREGVDEAKAAAAAKEIVQHVRSLLRKPGPDPALEVDLDLRPEGKSGPLSRSLDGYRQYFDRWAQTWERQALLRARPVAGDDELGRRFIELIEGFRYPEGGLDQSQIREIRKLKARMEAERLPRGADPKLHLKLGRGGLSDVEWTVQLIQLQHGYEAESLRTTGTLEALQAALAGGYLDDVEATALREAWEGATLLRDAAMLWRARPAECIPADHTDAEAVSRILGWPPGQGPLVSEWYLKRARHAREVTERRFFGQETT